MDKPQGMTTRDFKSLLERREQRRRAEAYPRLVDALETIARLAESGSMSLGTLIRCGKEARAAIAKAKGEQ